MLFPNLFPKREPWERGWPFPTNDYNLLRISSSFTFLVCLHSTGNSFFAPTWKGIRHSINSNGRELEQVVHTHRTLYQSGWPRGQFSEINHGPLSWKCGSQPKLAPTHLPENLFTLRQEVAETYPIFDDPHFKMDGSAVFSLTEIAGKSPFLF